MFTSTFLGKNPLTSQTHHTFNRSRANLNGPISNTFIVFCWNKSETILLQGSPELLIALSSTCAEVLWVEIGLGAALGIESMTSCSAVKQATDWANPAAVWDQYRLLNTRNYSLVIHLYLLYKIRIRYSLKLLRGVRGEGGGQGFPAATISMTLPPRYMYFHAKQKKSTAKSTPLTVWSLPNSYCIYLTNSIGVCPDPNQKRKQSFNWIRAQQSFNGQCLAKMTMHFCPHKLSTSPKTNKI